jgi:hypothetical protein
VYNFLSSAQVGADAEKIDYERVDVGSGTYAVHDTFVETVSIEIAHDRKSQIQ